MFAPDIVTDRLVIKSMTLADAGFAAMLWGDEEGGKYLADPYYKSEAELTELISDIAEWEDDYPFIAYLKETGEPVGTCSVGPEGGPTQWGFGYCVRKNVWGKGYATEMAEAMLSFAYSKGIREFQGTIATENTASARVMEKCGMRLDRHGSFKKRGTDIVYASSIYHLHLD